MKKISYLIIILGVLLLGGGIYLLFSDSSLDKEEGKDDSSKNSKYNNPLVCSNSSSVYNNHYMADTDYQLIYDYDDSDTTVLSLTSRFIIKFSDESLEEATDESRQETIEEIEKEECLSGGREYSGVSKSCKAEWEDDNTVVVTVEWDIDNPNLEYGQDLPKSKLKSMLENESEYSGVLFCK